MPNIDNLLQRIDTEFAAGRQKVKEFQANQLQAYEGREKRLVLFGEICEKLREVWRPRLEALAQKFGENAKVTPSVSRHMREATFAFDSSLAQILLRFTASTDEEVRKLVLDYRLEILPILMKFEPHKQMEQPLEAVDVEAVGKWIDDRIVDFVKTYLSLHQNEYYLKDHMVVDPIAKVQFPKFAAAAKVDWQGKTYYFIADKTRAEFAQKNGIS